MKHRYLFTLQVAQVETGKTYDELPSHLTLMSRFFSELSPEQITKVVRPLFANTKPIELSFGTTAELGPKKLTVHLVTCSGELKQLHSELRSLLDSINVTNALNSLAKTTSHTLPYVTMLNLMPGIKK